LAKAAADRFRSGAEFAAAIAQQAAPTPVPSAAPPPGPSRRRSMIVAAGAVGLTALAITLWRLWASLFPGPPPEPPKKSWILVAEFDGPAADSSVVTATRDMVMAALDQSKIVATVPREQINLALRSAGKPTSTRVDAELARELAYRSSVRTVLEGRIGRL